MMTIDERLLQLEKIYCSQRVTGYPSLTPGTQLTRGLLVTDNAPKLVWNLAFGGMGRPIVATFHGESVEYVVTQAERMVHQLEEFYRSAEGHKQA